MKKIIDLPIIICGEARYLTESAPSVSIDYNSGITLRFPKVMPEDIEKIKAFDKTSLSRMSINEIVYFLEKVGKLWQSKEFEMRNEAIELSSKITGYDPYIINRDYHIVGEYCATRTELFDQIDAEFGSHFVLDEWMPKHDCMVKAVPRGKVLHIMVGNIPIASVFTTIRSILTKNLTIAKLSSRDPVTSLYFLLSFLQIDPEHPVTKSLSVMFWKGGDEEIENPIMDLSDVICVWGGEEAVKKIKPKVPFRAEYIEFGPKRSFSILDLSKINNIDNAAARLASDMCLYNQEACFSPLAAFFIGGITEEFIERLKYWLRINNRRMPKGRARFDDHAHVSRTKLEELFKGNDVIESKNNQWTLVFKDKVEKIEYHPLGRTMFLYNIKSVDEVLPLISTDTQTIGVFPWEIGFQYKDLIAEMGADRICELGTHTLPRPGFPHDSIYPLTRMVRWMNLERPMSFKGKYNDDEAATGRLYYGYNQEFIAEKYKNLGYS